MGISTEQKELLKSIGARVKEIRNRKGLTLKDVAYKIGKDPQSIHRLESGNINPSYLYLLELCEGLGVDIKEIFNNS